MFLKVKADDRIALKISLEKIRAVLAKKNWRYLTEDSFVSIASKTYNPENTTDHETMDSYALKYAIGGLAVIGLAFYIFTVRYGRNK